jgi:hypothetical protein
MFHLRRRLYGRLLRLTIFYAPSAGKSPLFGSSARAMASAETPEHAAPTALTSTPNEKTESSTEHELLEKDQSDPAVSNEAVKSDGYSAPGTEPEKDAFTSHEVETDEGANHVHGAARIALVFGLCVTTFLVGLDQLIIATAIPKITTLFHSLEDVGWYG